MDSQLGSPLSDYPLVDYKGNRFYFHPSATFLAPTVGGLSITSLLGHSCHVCGCNPCVAKFFRPNEELRFPWHGPIPCYRLMWAALPGLLEFFLRHFESGAFTFALRPKVLFQKRLAKCVKRVRDDDVLLVFMAYLMFGFALPPHSSFGEEWELDDVDTIRCHIENTLLYTLNCSATAESGRDYAAIAYIRVSFNIDMRHPQGSTHSMYCINTWCDRVLSMPFFPVIFRPGFNNWSWMSIWAVPPMTFYYLKRLPPAVVSSHIPGQKMDLASHVFTPIFPWMGDALHRRTVAHLETHIMLHKLVDSNLFFGRLFGVSQYYDGNAHSQSMFKGELGSFSFPCPHSGCVSASMEGSAYHSEPRNTFSSWVDMLGKDIRAATNSHLEPVCGHTHEMGDDPSDGVQEYLHIRNVVECIGNCGVVQAPYGALSDSAYPVMRLIKQANSAPTSRCTGMSDYSPMCNEMGILLR